MGDAPILTENVKPTYVAHDLSSLCSAVAGEVTLPISLDWTPLNSYCLNDPKDKKRFYETVLSNACSERDIELYIEEGTLRRLWPSLNLPRRTRYAWESIHPELGFMRKRGGYE
jgi:hypothetical protein